MKMIIGKTAGVITLLCLAGLIVFPGTAGERYIAGSPDLTAAIYGANEFYPGTEVTIPVILQNSGLIEYVFTYPTTLTPADLPNMAKLMIVTLGPGTAPVTIESDPQMVGDLKGGDHLLVNFKARISPDAPSGTYVLPLNVQYTYLWHADQYGQDTLQYFYREANTTIDLPIRIRPEILLEIVSVRPEAINVGTEGYVYLTLRNAGNENGRDAVVKLAQVGNSPVLPVSSSIYIGNFSMDSNVDLKYRISVSKDAEALSYPVNVSVIYKNRDGNIVSTDSVIVGVPVSGKVDFEVASSAEEVTPGSQDTLVVEFRNSGSAPVYGAQARIYTVDRFTTNDDTSYLGDMAPGETRTGRFEVSVDPKATVKDYALDSEIRYRDALDNDQVSDRFKVPVRVVPLSGVVAVLTNPAVIVLIAVIAIIGVYFVMKRRKTR